MRSLVFFLSSLALGAQTVWFEANVGQVKGQTEWVGHSKGAYLYITGNEVVYANKTNTHMRLFGATAHARVEGFEPTGGYSNYFTGRDEKTWFTGIPHYARLQYKDVYPGIDLVYYGSARNAEYDFVVKPGGNPDRIELAFSEPVRIDHGDLVVGSLRQHRPRVIQDGIAINADYTLGSAGRVRLALGGYDRTHELTIDPVLEFSTFLGGPGEDLAHGIALDSAGNIFVAMSTQSPATPSLNPFQQTNLVGLQPAVFKFTPDGKQLLYSSVIGSGGWDPAYSIALDSNDGSPIITGSTQSPNFPLKNPIQAQLTAGIHAAFMTKLSPDGRSLIYSTYLGGTNRDDSIAVAVDAQGNAYFGGYTNSRDFPIKNAIQPNYGGSSDCFLAKITASGALAFSTYYGGSGREFCGAVSLTRDGGVLLGGSSNSSDFPFKNAIQTQTTARGGYNTPALMKFTADGQSVVFATYYGGPAAGDTSGVTTDTSGNIYVDGWVGDNNFKTKNAYQSVLLSDTSAFLAKFDANMQNAIFATYLGGSGRSMATAIAVDSNGNAYVAGQVGSADFPTKNSLQKFLGGGIDGVDVFISKFDPSGSALLYSTFLGGSGGENVSNIALDSKGNAYIVGWTLSLGFPVKNAFQPSFGGGGDGFLTKISDDALLSQSPITVTPSRVGFQYIQGGSLPSSQSVAVAGGSFTPTSSTSWLAASSLGSSLTVSVLPAGLAPGAYTGSVQLTPPAGTPATVDVSFLVLAPAAVITSLQPPIIAIGSDDTRVTVHGSGFTKVSVLQVNGIPWLTTPVQFVDPSTLVFSVPAANLMDAYTLSISVQNSQSALSNVLALSVGVLAPSFTAASVVNAGSFAGGPVAPGEIVTIFGTNLAGNVAFDNIPATIVYSSATQISSTVPYTVTGPTTALKVGTSIPVSLDVAPSAPGIFAAVSNGDGTLTLYATGCGALTRDALPLCQLPVSATINGEPAPVLYAGIAPGLVEGANQINIALPSDIGSAQIAIVLTAGNASSKPFSFTLP